MPILQTIRTYINFGQLKRAVPSCIKIAVPVFISQVVGQIRYGDKTVAELAAEKINHLVKRGFNFIQGGNTSNEKFFATAEMGSSAALETFVDEGWCIANLLKDRKCNGYHWRDTDRNGKTLLIRAAEGNNKEVVEYLLKERELKVDAGDINGNTALHEAAKNGNYEITKFLLLHRATADIKNDDGDTPIHVAAKKGHLDIVKYLVEEVKVDTGVQNTLGVTPLLLAAATLHKDVVEYLANKGASVDLKAEEGVTPLFAALSRCGSSAETAHEIASILLKKGANPNGNKGEMSPLHLAMYRCSDKTVDELLKKGANLFATNKEGNPPTAFIEANEVYGAKIKKVVANYEKSHSSADDSKLIWAELSYSSWSAKEEDTTIASVSPDSIKVAGDDGQSETESPLKFNSHDPF